VRHDRQRRDDIASDVRYELRMLGHGAERIWRSNMGQIQADGLVSNSLVEAFLVHARLLDDFLGSTSRGSKKRDVLAADFNPDWTPKRVLTQTERDEIGGKVAHLADDRIAAFPWLVSDILVRTFDRFEEFVDGCQECHEHFGPALAEVRPIVRIFRP
jgi:hypothetical protein